ncbi:transcriptional regulator [Candidatus Woesearchaeota archaeon CG10_big_fil_rev_8_21_14_0_10_36_11]|nr:MAG: transcriptional regulator [Candidatus Woesearchaeota archaeon CG10_big_fil_rev_8_21_14_0_10_36_11]
MNKKELDFLLKEREGYNLEFKETDSNLAKEICALANANGGKVLLGVTDEGKIKGVNITNKFKSQITDLARNFDPKFQVTLEEIDKILVVNVPEGKNKPYSANGKFHLRIGPNSQQLSRDEIREFFLKEGLILWDEKENKDFDLEKDFNKEAFNNFVQKSNMTKVLSKKELLQNLSLLKNNHLKNAGVLLFSKDVQKFFLKGIITCVLYEGTDKVNIIDKKDFTKDLYSNYSDAINYIKSKLNTRIIITGGPHQKKLELPEKALREALVNAIGHRDYNVRGAKVLVEISLDKVEITNPGGLVKGLKKEDFGKKSLSRNNLLFGLLQRIDLVEDIGSGIKRMRKLMKADGLEEPIFEFSRDWFSVSFKRPLLQKLGKGWGDRLGEKLGDNQKKIIELMEEDKYISISQIAEKIGISTTAVENNIAKLKEKGLIQRVGSAKAGYWYAKA